MSVLILLLVLAVLDLTVAHEMYFDIFRVFFLLLIIAFEALNQKDV